MLQKGLRIDGKMPCMIGEAWAFVKLNLRQYSKNLYKRNYDKNSI